MVGERASLPFDGVVVDESGVRKRLTPKEFLALPLPVRVRALLDDSLEFLLNGRPVDRKQALAALRQAWTPH
jgi:hypothetical protein